MSAIIIPFAPRYSVAAKSLPISIDPERPDPPLVTWRKDRDGRLMSCQFTGTMESLIFWKAALDGDFPTGRKRRAYSPTRPLVKRLTWPEDLFTVDLFLPGDVSDETRGDAQRLINEVLDYSAGFQREASKRLSGLWPLRQELFNIHNGADYDPGSLQVFDSLVDGLEKTIAATLRRRHESSYVKALDDRPTPD